MAQRIDGNLADDGIIVGRDVTFGGIGVFDDAMARVANRVRRSGAGGAANAELAPSQTYEAQNCECLMESWGPSHIGIRCRFLSLRQLRAQSIEPAPEPRN